MKHIPAPSVTYAVVLNGVVAFTMHARTITEVANATKGALNVRILKCRRF